MIVNHSTSFTVYPDMCNYLHTHNAKPMIHGGYLTMQMDRCAADLCRLTLFSSKPIRTGARQLQYTADYAVTVGIDKLVFNDGAELGDLLTLNASVLSLGVKRITISVVASRIDYKSTKIMAHGQFAFCAMSTEKQDSHPHGLKLEKEKE